MDLKDFIAKTLSSIRDGVKEANTDKNNFVIYAKDQVVNFNVAVEIGQEKSGGKSGALRIKVVEGNIDSSSKTKESSISRIDFTVGVKSHIQ